MIPIDTKPRRVMFRRNRGGFLLGATWSHQPTWPTRTTHLYLGFHVLTIKVASRTLSAWP